VIAVSSTNLVHSSRPSRVPDRYGAAVRLEQVSLLPIETLAGHPADSPLMQDFAKRVEWFHPESADGSWLAQGNGTTFYDMVELAARAVDPDEPVDLAVTVTSTSDSGPVGYPGGLLHHLLPGNPLMLGITEQGAAGPFTAVRIAADRIAAGDAERALVLVMEQCRLPAEAGTVLPARDRAVLIVLGPMGRYALRPPLISRTGPAEHPAGHVVTPAGGEDAASEGITGVWAALARQWSEFDGAPVTVTVRDAALSYWCRLDLDPVPGLRESAPAEADPWARQRIHA
jgi:hypothetical protein